MDLSTFGLSHRIDWTPRPDTTSARYQRRLAKARLTKSELQDIEVVYGILDEERAAEHLPSAERAHWSPADILEWRDMNDVEKYLDLKILARAADRATATRPISLAGRDLVCWCHPQRCHCETLLRLANAQVPTKS